MKLKKVATITQEEATKNKELLKEADELSYAIHKFNIKQRRFLNTLMGKYLDPLGDTKPYIVKGKGIYTNG